MDRFITIIVLVFLFTALSACVDDTSTSPPPAIANINFGNSDSDSDSDSLMTHMYDFVQSYQLSYIRSLQLQSGAIKDNSSGTSKITPYFANFAVRALLTDPTDENLEVVRNYMLWYFGKLNNTVTEFSESEIAGSIYDYYAPDETTSGTYDSVDSYAATFLEIAYRFADISVSCLEWLSDYVEKVSLVADAMLKTIDFEMNSLPGENVNDCLSIAHYGYAMKYLMDNSEVNMGLRAAIWLQQNDLLKTDVDLEDILSRNTASINSTFFNSANGNYDYAKNHSSDWNTFYPSATAQLYPCLFGVNLPSSSRSVQMYETFNTYYPDWPDGTTYDAYPWTMIVHAAAVMNDKDRVDSYVTHIYGLNSLGQQKSYWYNAEAGSLVLAIARIRNND